MSIEVKIRVIRLAIFGDSKVGKTSICKTFFDNEFNEDEISSIFLIHLAKK